MRVSGFTHDEYVLRQEKARVLLAGEGLDGLFVTDPGNLFYFTGYPFSPERSFPRPAVFILPLKGEPVLVAHDFYFPFTWRGELRRYQPIGGLPIELVSGLLKDRCGERSRIGAELGHEQHLAISYNDFGQLRKRLSTVSFLDAARVLWRLRMVKTQQEVSNITEACRIHDSIFKQCFAQIELGMSARDIELLFQRAALDAGGKSSGAIVCIGAFDPEQAAGSSLSTKRLSAGDLCWVDFSLGWQGYRTDYCRAVVAGGPSRSQSETWDKVNQVLVAARHAARPGEPCSAVCAAQLSKAEELGLDMNTWTARRYGHGSGIHTTEPPSISLEDDTPLAPNMVIHLEPGVIGTDGIYVREEMSLITEQGCELLSKAPWELGTL